VWWPFRFCECQSGATLKANYSVICWMEPVDVKTKIGKTMRLDGKTTVKKQKSAENR
jgi:hypothetical protein